jgi:hypothetical protein
MWPSRQSDVGENKIKDVAIGKKDIMKPLLLPSD